jgi:translocator assembly and maintenance protein 41
MHKPVHIFRTSPRVLLAAQANLFSALRYSLLSLPPRFTAVELYEQIAKISYTGDPRMAVPGAENPQKVKNIVAGQRDRFDRLYAGMVQGLGVKAVDGIYEVGRVCEAPLTAAT